MKRETEEETSPEEEATVAGEGGAGPHPVQEAVEGEDCRVPTGETGEVGDSAVPPNMHPTLPQLPG